MHKYPGKNPIVIVVDGERYVLQVPCTTCHGGVSLLYDPTTSNRLGRCHDCTSGLVDTPLFAAIKKHLGSLDGLPGTWRGNAHYGFAGLSMDLELVAVQEPLHFYPEDWIPRKQFDYALCCQGEHREDTSGKNPAKDGSRVCQNCLRIKTLKEQANPVVYG